MLQAVVPQERFAKDVISKEGISENMPKDSFSKEELSTSISVEGDDSLSDYKMMLPQGEMQLLDRVVHLSKDGGNYGRGEIIAEFDIHPDLWFFKCHFPGDPIMPGCLGIDALWQTLGVYLAWQGHSGKCRALGVSDVKFGGEILPDTKTVRFHVHVKRIIHRGMTLAIGDGVVLADGKEIYSAKNLKAALI
jgi:3-hydroxyacyl-[acyl-carrier protein] dehydratase/trans-2-decenoyl-[acyl-carrier protein] isomerase